MNIAVYTLGYMAHALTGDNLAVMARKLNNAGLKPRLDESHLTTSTQISKSSLLALLAGAPRPDGDLVESQLNVLLGP